MKTCRKLFIGLFVSTCLASAYGCGGGSGTAGGQITTSIGAGGGTAQDATKKATLTIPAGALSQSTNVTVAAASSGLPSNSQIVPGTTFTLGPSGTTFATPATLTIGYDPVQIPNEAPQNTMSLFTVTADGKDWQKVTGSVVDVNAHTVSGSISSTGTYAILAANPFVVTNLHGTFTGTNNTNGTFVMTIGPSGTLTVTNTPGETAFSGIGNVSLTGTSSFTTATGTGTATQGITFSFTGTFQNNGSTITASGTWKSQQNSSALASGTWSIP